MADHFSPADERVSTAYTQTRYSPRTVCVDFDGVIHAYSQGWQLGDIYDEPVPGSIEAIRKLQEDGWAVVVHSTRSPVQIYAWMKNYDFSDEYAIEGFTGMAVPEFWNDTKSILITSKKIPAVAYIDDRGIRFENWNQAMADLKRFS